MNKENDFSRISDLFSLRSKFDDISSDSNYADFINKIPKYDKSQYSVFSKCKNWGEVYGSLDKMKYNYEFDENVINEILNMSLSFKEINAYIFYTQILSFYYEHSNNRESFDDKNFLKIINALICLNPDQTQAKPVYTDIYQFFANSIVLYFNNYHQYSVQQHICVSEIIKFYTSSVFLINVDFLTDFVNISKDVSDKHENSLLDLVIDTAQRLQFSEKILIFIQPLCEKFNEKALNCLALLPPFPDTDQIIKEISNQICQSAGEIDVKIHQEEPSPISQKDIEKFNYELIETESRFSGGFKCFIEDCDNESEFLIRILNKSVRKKIFALSNSLQFFQQNYVKEILNTVIEKFNASEKNGEKFSLFIIFIVFCDKISKNSIVSDYSDFIFNSFIFNQNVTVFNKKKLDPVIETIRSLVFSILSSNRSIDFEPTMSTISNPLFMAEFLARIKNLKDYSNDDLIDLIVHTSFVLRKLDLEKHSSNIEKARSSVFLVLSKIFLEKDDSFKFFEKVMQFCYEKNVTLIFVYLLKECLRLKRNHYEFEPVFKFINSSMKSDLEITWMFIKIVSEFFYQFRQSPELTHNIFDILINFLQENLDKNDFKHSFEALNFVIEFTAHYQKLTAFQISIISIFICKFDSSEMYENLVSKIGSVETKLVGKEGFLIQHPIFLPIFALTYGFTPKILKLFNELIDFSLLNASYFHRYKIDYIILQYLINRNETKIQYGGVDFEIKIGDPLKMKSLLHKIMKVNSDYSIISVFLDSQTLMPELYHLLENSLNDPRPVVPFGFFKSNYFCNKLNSSNFQKSFTLTFWILIDTFVEIKKLDLDLITFYCNNNNTTLRIFIEKSQIKISLETNKNITEVILRQGISYQMKWRLFTLIFDSDSCLISTYIDDGDLCQSKFVPIPFQNNSQVKLSVGGSSNSQFLHKICGYIGTISFYNRCLSVDQINLLMNVKTATTTFDPSAVVVSSSIAGDFTYIKNSYTNETLLSTLCNPSTVKKIFDLLLEEETEEGCYRYLSLIDSLALAIPIEVLPIYKFIIQENHYKFTKVYKIILSIFSHISEKFKNDDSSNNNNSKEKDGISGSSSMTLIDSISNNNVIKNLNLNFIKNTKQELNLQQKWFRYIIINIDIWIKYVNFDEILYLWNSKLLTKYQNLFSEAPFISTFLSKIEIFEKENASRYQWTSFFIFLERLSFIHMTSDEEGVLFSMISELISKFQKLMTTKDYMKGTLKYCTLPHEIKRIKQTLSNLDEITKDKYSEDDNITSSKSSSKKKKFHLKERIKNRFHRHKKKKYENSSDHTKIATSVSVDSIRESSLEEESETSSSLTKHHKDDDDNENKIISTDDENSGSSEDDDNENSSNTNKENETDDENEGENSSSNTNKENESDDENNNNDDDDNNNDEDENIDKNDKEEVEEFKKGKKIHRLFKNKLFTKPWKKRKSLEYDHKAFGLIGFSSKIEMEKASNQLVYLLQLSHFTRYGNNSKNSNSNSNIANTNTNTNNNDIDDDNDETNTENSILVSSNSPRDGKPIPDFFKQIFTVLQKESKQYYVVFPALRIKDETIACVALFGIHETIPHTSVLKYTSEALRVIDPRIYDGIIKILSKQIHMYPYLFPLFCALIIFNGNNKGKTNNQSKMCSIFHNEELIANLNKVFVGDNFEKWIFFPVFLAFFADDRNAKEEILSVIVHSVSTNWDAVLSAISLITYLQDFFPEDDTLLIFYMLLTNYNYTYQDNNNLGDIFVQVCYSFFFVATPTKTKEQNVFNFSNIDDVLKFVSQNHYSSFNVNFFIKLEKEKIVKRGLKDLALSQLTESVNYFRIYNQDYIRNLTIVLNSILHFNEIETIEIYSSLCKFIEKMRIDYKEQYSKSIHSVLDKVKKSLSSKCFQDFTSEKFIMSISNSKNSESLFDEDDIVNQDFLSTVSNKNKFQLDHFAQFGLKLKHSIDPCYRQCILEQLSTTNPERKNEIKEINVNCHIYKKDGDEPIPASFEMKKGVITIKTEFKSFKFDRRDVCGFKRENQAIEFITNEGKLFFVIFNDTEANKILRNKMTNNKTASRNVTRKMLQKYIDNWEDYKITTFQLLMFINFFIGRTQKSLLNACFPSMLSNDLQKKNHLFEFSDDLNVNDMNFDVDFANEFDDEENDNNSLIDQMKNKNVVSAQLYYFFESISKNKNIPSEIAKDRFEFIYKIRKMIEKTINIEIWIDKVFHINVPHRNLFSTQKLIETENEIEILNERFLFDKHLKVKLKFASKIEDNEIESDEFVYKFIICSTEGQLFIVTEKDIFEIADQSVDISNESKFFALKDGIVIYNNKLHSLILVDKEGKTKSIKSIFIDPSIASFTGSIRRIVYLSTPTRINLVREQVFKGNLVIQKNSEKKKILVPQKTKPSTIKLDMEGNQQIHQLPSCVRILRASLDFNIIVTFSEDNSVRILSLYDHKSINEFNLNGKEAIELIITKSFGFIFVATKSKAYLLTNNGTLIKKVRFDFSNVSKWFSFTSRDGIDFIGMVVKNDADEKIMAFEAFYLDRINDQMLNFGEVQQPLSISFDKISGKLFSIDQSGKITAISHDAFE